MFSKLIGDVVDRLWEMRDLDREIAAFNQAVPMPRTPPAFVRSIGSRLHSRTILRFPIPKRAQSIGRSGRVDVAIYGRRANWTRGSSWRA